MAGQKWKRAAAFLLAGGMLLSPCQYVFAAEGQAQESASAAESGTLTVLDGNGSPVAVSDTVFVMLDAGTVYLDEASGYLLSTADGTRIDPVTGEAIAESEEEPSEEPDEPQSPENPDTGTGAETPGDTGKTENPEGQTDDDDSDSLEDSKDTGASEDTENPEDTGDTENPEESGDNGDISLRTKQTSGSILNRETFGVL